MAYRLERDESVIAGLKRVVCDEIGSAEAQLSGDKPMRRDKAIHESRKNIKKVRALLRLVSGELGDTWTRENARLRDIARRLSDFRDAFVMIATFDDLKETHKSDVKRGLTSVRAGLMKQKRESSRDEDVALVLNEAASALRKAAKRVKSWPLHTEEYAGIGPGLRETYRAGRKALARARKSSCPLKYHELRKRVKDHWYHIRLLENLWSDVMSGYEKSLKELETWLGDDHNLAVLRDRIVAEPAFFGNKRSIDLVLELIEGQQKELRGKSLSLAERIYEEKPREFDRRIGHLWETWRHQPEIVAE
ncbi:MAG TPA: CHAD domain-containing protein [Bryobacteraceae bacterium]|nr:CHAD domain-containing protein [Bryobacteraceae bacterium]